MANTEHVKVVKRGMIEVLEWRQENPGVVLDLREADLKEANLGGIGLVGIDYDEADNSLEKGVVVDFIVTDLSDADLRDADLRGAYLLRTNLSGANLSGTDLRWTDLSEADLNGANLSGADLSQAYLLGAVLNGANLSGADLSQAPLLGPVLNGANLSDVRVRYTAFAACNLSKVSGLETVQHEGPSSIGTDTLLLTYQGAGNPLPPALHGFFIKAGVPASLLDALPRIAGQVQYHSAFIAYGEPDRDFAERLYGALQSKGVSCWTYAMDATPGKRTWHEIGQRRREAGKFIVEPVSES